MGAVLAPSAPIYLTSWAGAYTGPFLLPKVPVVDSLATSLAILSLLQAQGRPRASSIRFLKITWKRDIGLIFYGPAFGGLTSFCSYILRKCSSIPLLRGKVTPTEGEKSCPTLEIPLLEGLFMPIDSPFEFR